ncbi:MAG: 16S rRNA (cytosine(1402)-N(4))-methyltransferase RsmH [Parcubacteria group bacterium]
MHIPVLQKEAIEYLNPESNENFIDCTINGGGHALAILEKTAPRGRLLGIDLDREQIQNSKFKNQNLKKRLILVNDNFANLEKIIKEHKFKKISGILLDLGFSSWHIEESGRGFSFSKKEPLDMRYDVNFPLTAEKILNYWSELDLEKILREYGQEPFSKEIAKGIIEARKLIQIKNTLQLVGIIGRFVDSKYRRQKIHFATRTFQALRIAVNDELDNLKKVLPRALEALEKEGRLVVISFHSLEDGIVKNFFEIGEKRGSLKVLTKKPALPQKIEIINNNRARSAKLRAAEKI